ncbi:molybdopterin molybdotransferase MoeA [Pikeienuella piscinae]|uniref:Molybdopterin molybdenumtransferase n=1 Tax=Pikeienuella piscinae TaxID=2748098 RepID=A0A7L5BT05_9RHOB|nr:gephyrin-like molybdotransferase Glp [Pikeienuella piscinae]QIE53971.1 molybdopterin molybdotransferase MoeA [Pikeienuella piscinae]
MSQPPLLSAAEALARILALAAPVGVETVPLDHAAGRVLAAPVIARHDQPPFAASAMDGYAVKAEDAVAGAELEVVGEVAAGATFTPEMRSGQAVRIFTGAPIPDGADTVLIQEDAERNGDRIRVKETPTPGGHIRPAGKDFRAGARLEAGRRLTANEIALAASMNAPMLEVRRRPLVSLIATGDELVTPGEQPGPSQIISSNNYGLAAMLEAAGAEARIEPIARDDAASLKAALGGAEDADLIVTLGGASVGDHDLVRSVFAEEGLDLSFYRVAMRPGKPLMAGRVRGRAMVGLPGNPVSSMVLGRILLRPMIDAFLGLDAAAPPRVRARLGSALPDNGPREHYMRARLEETPEGPLVFPFPDQDSSLLSVLAAANALIVMPPGAAARKAGEEIDTIRL